MRYFQKLKRAMVLAALVGVWATGAQASYTVTISQVGVDVVASGAGTSFNLAALSPSGTASASAGVLPISGYVAVGVAPGGTNDAYCGLSGPSAFGSGNVSSAADTATGASVGIIAVGQGCLYVPAGYVSGTPLAAGTATWNNQTIAGMNMTPGTYTWSWGSGPTADSFTLNIAAGLTGLTVTPTSLDFGSVALTQTSAPLSVTVTNTTGAPIGPLTTASSSMPPWVGVAGCNGVTLAPGASCANTYTFAPTSLGAQSSAGMTFTINGVVVPLSFTGTGILGLSVNPSSIDFGSVAVGSVSASQAVTVTNTTSAPIGPLTTASGSTLPWIGVAGCNGQTLAAGASCANSYIFAPTLVGPQASSGMTFTINGVTFPLTFTGTGVPASAAPSITSGTLPDGTVGVSYGFTVTASGLPSPTFSDNGTLPPGLQLAAATGVITGYPTQAGTFNVQITASNAVQPDATVSYLVTIAPAAVAGTATPVPALSQWGVMLLALVLGGAAIRRRHG